MRIRSLCLILIFLTHLVSAGERPNIIILLADDLGWTGLGCFGGDFYDTPHLDKMASQGMKFTNFYAACTVCSLSRASIMTGKYPARLHLTDSLETINRDLFRHYPHYHPGGDGPYRAIRSGNYRLTESLEDGSLELNDLSKDIGEQNNLAATLPELCTSLHGKLKSWSTEIGAQMPTENPNYDPAKVSTVVKK